MALTISTSGCTGDAGDTKAAPGPTVATGQQERLTFDDNTTLPAGAESFSGDWQVRAEADTPSAPNALCQIGTAQYPAIALGTGNYRDAVITTRSVPISGTEDQAAGIIFRIVDRSNYYILRANALEDNVNLYKYADGNRTTLAEGQAVLEPGGWYELRVEVTGNTMTGYLDSTEVVTADDSGFASGRVGLWTKADSRTCFDDVIIQAR